MVAAIERRRSPSAPPRGPTTVPPEARLAPAGGPPKPEQGSRGVQDQLHVAKLLAHLWETIQMVGQTAFQQYRCPATGVLVTECPGCRGPRVADAPSAGALPHFPATLAYLEKQAQAMRALLDLHQRMGDQQ